MQRLDTIGRVRLHIDAIYSYKAMIYVDENLCTGCGLCVEACKNQALSLQGSLAVLDAESCTSCNRCAAVCVTGAIRTAHILPTTTSSVAPDQALLAPSAWSGAYPGSAASGQPQQIPVSGAVPPSFTGQTPASSARNLAGKLFSVLASLFQLAWERGAPTLYGNGGIGKGRGAGGGPGAGRGKSAASQGGSGSRPGGRPGGGAGGASHRRQGSGQRKAARRFGRAQGRARDAACPARGRSAS